MTTDAIRHASNEYFKVGGRYENRKGAYEVVSVQGPNMVIRWDSGETAETDLKGQLKVIQNMEREFREKIPGKSRGKVPSSYGELFAGLRDEDFSLDVTGTHWRSREQLGGAVARGIETTAPMNSWSIYKRAEVHWADWQKYPKESAWLQAKFAVFMVEGGLWTGFYVERSNKPEDSRADWNGMLGWIADGGDATLRQTVARHELCIENREFSDVGAFPGCIRSISDAWQLCRKDGTSVPVPSLSAFLDNLPKDKWVNLFIGKTIQKTEALALGAGIATLVAGIFTDLLPLYEAAIKHAVKKTG